MRRRDRRFERSLLAPLFAVEDGMGKLPRASRERAKAEVLDTSRGRGPAGYTSANSSGNKWMAANVIAEHADFGRRYTRSTNQVQRSFENTELVLAGLSPSVQRPRLCRRAIGLSPTEREESTTMPDMSTAERAPQATAMIVERGVVAETLLGDETRYEPFVMLEDDGGHTRVRKLTVPEKLAHSERTGASVFMADEQEQEEFFSLLDAQAER